MCSPSKDRCAVITRLGLISHAVVISMLLGCDPGPLPPSSPCANRTGINYLATYTLDLASAPGSSAGSWIVPLIGDGDACETMQSGPTYTETFEWAADGSGATGTMVVIRTDPPTPGPSPGTYGIVVVTMKTSP